MTILVTGAGTIGLETAQLLRARGEAVVLADVRPVPAAALATDPGLVAAVCDVTDRVALERLVESHAIRRIVHTAALLSTAIRQDPVRGVLVNTVGTANVLEVARLHHIERVVVASSSTIGYTTFGARDARPIEENFAYRIVSQRPASIYAATKIASEHLALLYADLYALDVVILRYAAVLNAGPGPATSVPGRLLSRLLESGRSGRAAVLDDPLLVWGGREEFVDARDCARANVHALDAGEPRSRVYNVATGAWHTLAEFCDAVRAIYPGLGVDQKIASSGGFAGFPHLRPAPSDTRAAASELDFQTLYSLGDTIRFYAAKYL
jgi:UDP-glucose 4-epimerase